MSPRGRHRTTDPYDHDKNDSSFVDFPTTCEAIDNCTIPIDVVLASAEGRLFGAHSKNLELCTDGFPLAGSTTKSDSPEIVPLSDKGDTLLLFLKFIHNHPPPNLIDLDTDGLLDLAKVLDKYGSYIPLAMCRQQMKIRSENSVEDALKVLRFKITICDLEGIDAIARRTFQFSAVSMLETVFDEDHLREFAVWVGARSSLSDSYL
ncbi:hypothetical protein L218DRAFT_475228 [Marasmius fiardii PR-910]|nr:hypothetical protein L218DRAFT_475228 [Marasmius fiardii PR-910]